jgi:hypothetical protein
VLLVAHKVDVLVWTRSVLLLSTVLEKARLYVGGFLLRRASADLLQA